MNAPTDRLDQKTHARVLSEKVIPESGLNEVSSQAKPKAVILAGQPGAGKGGLARTAEIELFNDVVKIDPDELREFHPDVEQFRRARPYTWSSQTQHDAGQWADELLDATVAGKKHLIFDTTLSNGQWATEDLIPKLQAQGYDVEVRALAAHKLESELGVDKRFAEKLDDEGHGRHVPAGARDAIHDKLPGSLDMIHARTNVPIRLFNREGVELYDSRTDARLPGAALEAARDARLRDPNVTRRLSHGWQDQQAWHRNLPDTLPGNQKVAPETAQRLLAERGKLHVVEGVARSTEQATHVDFTRRVRPNTLRAAGAAGMALSAYDVADTAHDVSRLRGQGNDTAAQARIERFATQNVAGWGGAAAGMGTGTLAGVKTGPGLLVTGAIGGILGAVAGDKVADWLDERKINRQPDPQGNTWTFDPAHPERGWTIDIPPLPDTPQGERLSADAALSNRLTFQASSTSFALALASPPRSHDPYTLPASDQDARSAREAPWARHPDTRQWTREVSRIVDYRHNSPVYEKHLVEATPRRAAELEQQSQAVIARNAAQTPAAMASRFQDAYEHNGWAQYGPLPDAVTEALQHPGRIVGSDGDLYERDAQGQWTHDGLLWDSRAKGNLRHELDATDQRQQAEARVLILDTVRVTASPVIDAPETMPTRDPRVAQFLAALAADDARGMREASMAFAESERGRQTFIDAEQRVWDRQQRLPGRDHPLFRQALEQLEKVGPEVGGYLDRLQMESVAGALAHEAQKRYLPGIDELALSQDGQTLMARWNHPHDRLFDRHCEIDRFQAGIQPLDRSLQDLAAETQRQEDQALLQARQRQMQQEPGLSR